jgi:hypothetical protein
MVTLGVHGGRLKLEQNMELATVEIITPAQTNALRAEVIEAKNASEAAYWRLAAALHRVWDESAYLEWGYETFNDYVDAELDMQRRKAQYLVAIAGWFGEQSESVQDWVKTLGWTKARELVGVVDDTNLNGWREIADGASLREISEAVKAAKTLATTADDDDAQAPAEDKPKAKRFMLFDGQMNNVESALSLAKTNAGTEKDGHALDLICTEYLAQNGALNNLGDYLRRVEQVIGHKLIAFEPNDGVVAFGAETLDELFPEEE